jgi:hypothetical protein
MRLPNLLSLIIAISLLSLPKMVVSETSELQLRMLLPQQEHVLNIQLSKAPEFFTGSALNSYLKDSSDIYREYGIDTLMTTAYYYSGEIISVEIYRMKDYRSAYAIFTVTKMPKEAEFKVGDGSVKSKSSLIFWQDSYFVKIVSLGRTEGADKAMDGIARTISQRIGAHKPAPETAFILPDKDKVEESQRIVMGPLSFKRYFYFAPEQIFEDSANTSEGAIANYKTDTEFSFAIIKYPRAEMAKHVLDLILAELNSKSLDHWYLFDVLTYELNNFYFKINRFNNYLCLLRYKQKDLKYDWYLERIEEKIRPNKKR